MQIESNIMGGFITEKNFTEAESEFPGIRALYLACGSDKPRTFLELVARYLHAVARTVAASATSSR